MADFFALAKKYERVENPTLSVFITALKKQIEAFDNGKVTNRSWAKEDGTGYIVKIGKLEGTYEIPSRGEVSDFLHAALKSAHENEEFRKLVEVAYAPVDDAPPVKPKRGYNKKIKTDESATPLLPDTAEVSE